MKPLAVIATTVIWLAASLIAVALGYMFVDLVIRGLGTI